MGRALFFAVVFMFAFFLMRGALGLGDGCDDRPRADPDVTFAWTPVDPAPSMPAGTQCWHLTTNAAKSNPHHYLTCNFNPPAALAPESQEPTP